MKPEKIKNLHSLLIVIDDHADDPNLSDVENYYTGFLQEVGTMQ